MSENEKYDDLDKSIGRLKRAAIDAYVRDKIGGGAESFTRNKDGYEMVFSGLFTGTTMGIDRPGPDGEGGGTGFKASTSNSGPNYGGGSGSPSELDYTEEFNSVRRKIEDIVEPWRKLPNPETIDRVLSGCRGAVSHLSISLGSGGKGVAGGILETKLNSVHEQLAHMSGNTVNAFRSNVIESLQHVIGGLSAASTYWTAALGYEHGTFERARESVVDIVEKGIESFETVAKKSASSDLKTVITIGKLAKEGFSLIPGSEMASAIVKTLKLGLEPLKDLANEKEVPQTSLSYDDALASLTKAFKHLNETITTAEKAVEKNLIDNMGEMRKRKSSYDLKLAAAKSSDVSTSERLNIDQSRVVDILTRSKPKIIDELNSAWHEIQSVHMTTCVSRPGKIGIGINGPSSKFHDMKWLIHDLIEELTKETEYAFKDFEIAVELIEQGDSASKTKLEEMEQKIKDGSGLRPWQDRSIEKKMRDEEKQEQEKKKQDPGKNNQGNGKKK